MAQSKTSKPSNLIKIASSTIPLYIRDDRLEKLDAEIERQNKEKAEQYKQSIVQPLDDKAFDDLKKKLLREVNKHNISMDDANQQLKDAMNPPKPPKYKKASRTTVLENLIEEHL